MRRWLVVPSIGFHLGIIVIALVVGAWHIDRLEAAKLRVDIGYTPPPPPAESGSPAPKKQTFQQKQQKHITHEMVVPPEVKPPVAPLVADNNTTADTGTGNGLGSGTGSGEGSGSGTEPSPCTQDCGTPVVEKKHDETTVLPPVALTQLFISGDRNIEPPAPTKQQMINDGKLKVVASYKLCLDAFGNVASTKLIKSSGYSPYDNALSSGMTSWRYKPYTVDGHGTPACSVVTFVYNLSTIHVH
ncbi:MAG: energy transducer TonB [Kofleriaceae bacterium]